MFSQFVKRYLTPFLSGPSCTLQEGCDAPAFPVAVAECTCTTALGGINELYFVPCTETFSQENILDLDWWANLVGDGSSGVATLGRSGLGLGSIAKKSSKTDRLASCRTEQLIQVVWALKFQIKCFDKSSARSTCAKMNEMMLKSGNYLLVARMCDGDDVILPIGVFTPSDFDWTVPDNNEESQVATIELSWKELGFPCTIDVPGLSTILPKLS